MHTRSRDYVTVFLRALPVLILLGCVSSSVAPPSLSPGACVSDARFPGTWNSTRSSQFGPSSMRFSFDCDCTYESRVRFLFLMSIRERGSYSVKDGQLSFSRASGQITTWPFRFDGDRLILEESTQELHSYKRTKQRKCPDATSVVNRAQTLVDGDVSGS